MINVDRPMSPIAPRVLTPFAPAAQAAPTQAPLADAVSISGASVAAAPPAQPRRLFGALLAGMMLPAVLGGILTATPALAQSTSPQVTISQTQEAGPVADARTKTQASDIVEDGNTFRLPQGTQKIVFGHDRVATYDGAGKRTASQRYTSHVMTSSIHEQADPAAHAMMTEAPNGDLEIHVPAGAVRLQIEPSEMTPQHTSRCNGGVYALDRLGNILASEERSDVRITEAGGDLLAGATFGAMIAETRDTARIGVPPGTRSLVFNGSQTNNDGSVVALDGSGRALRMQPNWGGHLEAAKAGPLVSLHDEQVTIRVLPGTRQVELSNGAVRLLDGQGGVLAQQADAGARLADGPVE